MTPRGVAGIVALLAGAGLVVLAGPAAAQLPHLEPLPFTTPADSSSALSLTIEVGRAVDEKFDWRTDRLLMTVQLPAGPKARYFLRAPYLRFDAGDVPLASRWPWVLGDDAGEGWPGERAVEGFGQVEIGAVGRLRLPLLGESGYGVGLGVPVGSDRLYPVSSGGMPLRFDLRRGFRPARAWLVSLEAGLVRHFDSGGETIVSGAFPGGRRLGAALDWFPGGGSRFNLSWDAHDRDGHRSQVAGAQLWVPWAGTGAVGVVVRRELQGSLDRHAAWSAAVAWRLDSVSRRPGRGGEAGPESVQ